MHRESLLESPAGMPLSNLSIFPTLREPQSGHSWEPWANGKQATQASECSSLFDSSSKTQLSQDIPEGPAQASELSHVSGQAAKAHSL